MACVTDARPFGTDTNSAVAVRVNRALGSRRSRRCRGGGCGRSGGSRRRSICDEVAFLVACALPRESRKGSDTVRRGIAATVCRFERACTSQKGRVSKVRCERWRSRPVWYCDVVLALHSLICQSKPGSGECQYPSAFANERMNERMNERKNERASEQVKQSKAMHRELTLAIGGAHWGRAAEHFRQIGSGTFADGTAALTNGKDVDEQAILSRGCGLTFFILDDVGMDLNVHLGCR